MKLLPIKPIIKFEDLDKIDIRVGKIESVQDNEITPILAVPEKEVPSGVNAG